MTYQFALSKGTPRSSVLLHSLQACKHTPHWAVSLATRTHRWRHANECHVK